MWRSLHTPEVDLSEHEHVLRSHTIGWHRRHAGLDGLQACPEGRHWLAMELVGEAQRQLIRERLLGVLDGVSKGANPRFLARRLRRLADDVDQEKGGQRAVDVDLEKGRPAGPPGAVAA